MNLPQRLRYYRARVGISRLILAEQMEPPISVALVSKWEDGTIAPNPEQLGQIAKVLGCDLSGMRGQEPVAAGSARLAERIESLRPEVRSALWSLVVAIGED